MTVRQRTFGNFGLPAIVVTTQLPSDYVYCLDSKDFQERQDCIKYKGSYYSDIDDYFECERCTEVVNCDDGSAHVGYCESCIDDHYIECHKCDSLTDKDDSTECPDGHDWCESCYSEDHYTCEECSNAVHCDDSRSSDDGSVYCEECHSSKYTSCGCCSEELECSVSYGTPDGDEYCENCYNECYTTCESCEETISVDDATYNDYTTTCSDCVVYSDETEIDIPDHYNSYSGHSELTSNRKFGVELESASCSGYDGRINEEAWGVTTDPSVSGMEFVSAPLSGNDGLKEIRDLCEIADSEDFTVDRKCGVHVHIDMTGTTAHTRKALSLALYYAEDFFHSCIAGHRENTQFSNRFRHNDDDILSHNDIITDCNRYTWINWQAYRKHNTVEFRCMEGNFNADKLVNWVKLLVAFVDYFSDKTVNEIYHYFNDKTLKQVKRGIFSKIGCADLADYYSKEVCSA